MTSNDLQILSHNELQKVKNIGVKESSGLVIPLSKINGELFDKIIIDTPFENWRRTYSAITDLIKSLEIL